MSYKNNANGELLWTIGASTTTMTIKDSKGWLFPDTYPFYLTIEQIENNAVSKREIVECTNKTWDTFTITRSAWYCPASDTATTQTNTAFSFEDGSLVQLRAVAEDFDSFQNQIDAKLDADWSLRTWLWNHKIIYTNWSWNETELALWTTSQVLTSNWPTSAPTFESPSVDINSQAEKTAPTGTDEAIIYDGSWNKKTTLTNLTKWLSQASETVKWTVERATDAEATAWTDTTRYITPKQAKDNYWKEVFWNFTKSTNNWDNVVIAHWLWKTPRLVEVWYNATWPWNSWVIYYWVWQSTWQFTMWRAYSSSSPTWNYTEFLSGRIIQYTTAHPTFLQFATLSANSTNITFNYTTTDANVSQYRVVYKITA